MKILVAGLGSIGRRHLRNVVALGEHDIVLYRSQRSTLPDEELAGHPVETSLDAALAHRPDAVIVANPTALHLDVAIPAAEAGCHILLEKPVSHSLDRLDDLRRAVERSGSRVLVGFQFRFHPTMRLAAEALRTGAIGRPTVVTAHWGEYLPDWHRWEDYRHSYAARADLGGGVVLTLCHPLDYLRWWFGPSQRLWSFTGTLGDLDIPVEDVADIALQWPTGVLGRVHLNYLERPPAHWVEVVGTAGTLRWESADGSLKIYRAETGAWQVHMPPQGFERNTMFLDQMRHFLAVVRGEAVPECSLDDGIETLRSAVAITSGDRGADRA